MIDTLLVNQLNKGMHVTENNGVTDYGIKLGLWKLVCIETIQLQFIDLINR